VKRRKRRARRARRRNAFRVIVVAGVVTALCVAAFGSKKPEQVEERQQETTQEETTHAETVQNPETIVQTAEEIESKYKVFDTMSEDWGSCDLEGFVYYDLPEQYADKGYFPEKMQIYTRCLCKQNDVPYLQNRETRQHDSLLQNYSTTVNRTQSRRGREQSSILQNRTGNMCITHVHIPVRM